MQEVEEKLHSHSPLRVEERVLDDAHRLMRSLAKDYHKLEMIKTLCTRLEESYSGRFNRAQKELGLREDTLQVLVVTYTEEEKELLNRAYESISPEVL